ncbi:MAG: tRNA (guanosine(37)-N1)-methyltransferase TrmD [Candidatus Doudnabacteria bacterium]|nr:tRNA (guanosine(37)-N1)-methyltransferase TrmD [Candidatus Doudnabacteria bacterium]
MKFIILTLFPEAFQSYFSVSLLQRALSKKYISIEIKNLREFGEGVHKSVDQRPYGGGAGMVLRVDIMAKALKAMKVKKGKKNQAIILLTPQGKTFNQKIARDLSKLKTVVLICGRYEGFDERIRSLVDMEISIGDFVLTGGEVPAMAVLDTVARLVPGVVGKSESLVQESFSENMLEYPQYTRPEKFGKLHVPEILLSGNHGKIAEWRASTALKRTKKRRPDLLKK